MRKKWEDLRGWQRETEKLNRQKDEQIEWLARLLRKAEKEAR